jgi:hypothetical protein
MENSGLEKAEMQGREGIKPMDRGDDGQQWFPGHKYHQRKRVKVRLFPRCFFCAVFMSSSCARATHTEDIRLTHSHF